MKRLVQHKWLIIGVASAVILAGSAYLRLTGQGGSAMADPGGPYDPTSEYERDQIDRICDDLVLDRDALVALNLSAEDAESVMATIRSWRSTNAATLDTRRDAIDNAVHALRQIRRTIAIGPYDEQHATTLATRQQDLADARAAYETTLDGLRDDINEILSAAQESTWSAIQSGHGHRMPIRMLDLDSDQRVSISKAWQRYRMTYQAAATAQARSTAVSDWETARDGILTQDQKTVVADYHTNFATASQNVGTAIDTVLPPEEG